MGYSTTQARLYDKGMTEARAVLRLSTLVNDQIFLTGAETPSTFVPASPGAGWIAAHPLITSWGEATVGFDALRPAEDSVGSLILTALNGRMFTAFGAPTGYNRLSDFLATALDTKTAMASIFIIAKGPVGTDVESSRYYVFRGLLHDYEVIADGKEIVIRLVEDVRWNRPTSHPISESNHQLAPKENLGLWHPINYGQFGIWAQADYAPLAQNPFHLERPFFPACLNPGMAYETARPFSSTNDRHSDYSAGLANEPGYNVGPRGFEAPFMTADGVTALIDPSVAGSTFTNVLLTINPADEQNAVGRPDLKRMKRIRLHGEWLAAAIIFPAREVVGPNANGESTNITDLVWTEPRARTRSRLVDGDRYSWFFDDRATTAANIIVYELGAERNMGAIRFVRPFLIGRIRAGAAAGRNITITWRIDYASNASLTSGRTVTEPGVAPNPDTFISVGNFTPSDNVPPNNNLLDLATQAERWEFVQQDAKIAQARGMRFTAIWNKTNAAMMLDIVQVGLLVEFTPSRYFVENRVRTETVEREGYTAGGRRRRYTEDQTFVDRILAFSGAPNQQRMMFAGKGMAADPTDGFNGDNGIIQNPAEVIRHAVYNFGGGERDDDLDNPIIETAHFDYQSGSQRDFDRTENALDAEVVAATAIAGETFKVAVTVAAPGSVKDVIRSVQASVPGLAVFRVPEKPAFFTDSFGTKHVGAFGATYALVGAAPTFRRAIKLHTDTLGVAWRFTDESEVVNELRWQYGFSGPLNRYVRMLHFSSDVQDSGWPKNDSASEVNDPQGTGAGPVKSIVQQSKLKYGPREHQMELPIIYRWHEAITLRNNFIRWHAFQRVRLLMDVRLNVLDLLPGDVIQLDSESDAFMDCRFPLFRLPNIATPDSWNLKTFLVERVSYNPGAGGGVPVAQVEAIYNGKIGEN